MSFITDVGKFKKTKNEEDQTKQTKKKGIIKGIFKHCNNFICAFILCYCLTPLDFKKVPFTQFQTRMSHKKFQLCQVQRSDFV